MAFHFLIDEYPNTIQLSDGNEYRVVTNFKQILTIIELIDDPLFTEAEILQMMVGSFYLDKIPTELIEEAHKELLDFMAMYEDREDTEAKEQRGIKIFDYKKDSGKVYAAFLQQYRIDLRNSDMHWFEFSNLLNNLNDGKPNLVEVLQIRSMTNEDMKDLSPSTKSHYRKLKRKYSLDREQEEFIQRESTFDSIIDALNKEG